MERLDMHKVGDVGTMGFFPLCNSDDTACFSYPAEHLPKVKNFAGAGVTINLVKDATSRAACEHSSEGLGAPPDVYSINGTMFYSYDFGEGAGGYSWEGRSFRAYHNTACYEIGVGTEQYRCDGETTKDVKTGKSFCDGAPMVDNKMILDELMQVVSTFKFTK
jgi:hypothetical protein